MRPVGFVRQVRGRFRARLASDHADGIYLIYKYDRSVKFRINKVRCLVVQRDFLRSSKLRFDDQGFNDQETMKRYSILTAILFLGSSSGILAKDKLWTLPHSVAVYSEQNDKMKWGLSIKRDGDAFFARKEPVSIELYKDDGVIEKELYRKMTDKEQAPRLGTPIRK